MCASDTVFSEAPFQLDNHILITFAEGASNEVTFLQLVESTGTIIEALGHDRHGELDSGALAEMITSGSKGGGRRRTKIRSRPRPARLAAAEEHLMQVKAKGSQDTLNFPTMLNAKLSFLATLTSGSESRPTRAQEQLCEDLDARMEAQVRAVDSTFAKDLAAFNPIVRNADVPTVVVPEGK
jgi:hypothetical protein